VTDLPPWVYDVVIELQRWRDEHPKLYRYVGVDVYEKAEMCGDEALAKVPAEVQAAAEAIAAYLRARPTTEVNVPAMTLKSVVDAVRWP